jgi:hypothetical protein
MTASRRPAVEMATLWKPETGFHEGLGPRAQTARDPHSHKPHHHGQGKGADADLSLDIRASFEAP